VLRQNLARHGGEQGLASEATAREVLVEHAAWARTWRRRTLVVTTLLLAVNAGALSWYAVRYPYERTTTAIVAGLYGIGVPIVLWYDSLPWSEEVVLDHVPSSRSPPAPPVSLGVQPMLWKTPERAGVTLALSLSW
jgi:hypothetical protein